MPVDGTGFRREWKRGRFAQGVGRGRGPKRLFDSRQHTVRMFQLAAPDRHDAPPEAAEAAAMLLIVGDVAGEFGGPEFPVRPGRGGDFAVPVPVPEAAVDENDGAMARQHDVRRAGQRADMDPKSMAGAVEQRTHG